MPSAIAPGVSSARLLARRDVWNVLVIIGGERDLVCLRVERGLGDDRHVLLVDDGAIWPSGSELGEETGGSGLRRRV